MTDDQIREHLKGRSWADKEITPDIIAYMRWWFGQVAELEESYQNAEANVKWSNNLAGR